MLYHVSLYTLHAPDAFLQSDIDKRDDHRPWHLLCLNHCIIATRSGNGKLAKASYDLLITDLPAEAEAFFEMDMRKVNGKQHLPHCQKIMRAY